MRCGDMHYYIEFGVAHIGHTVMVHHNYAHYIKESSMQSILEEAITHIPNNIYSNNSVRGRARGSHGRVPWMSDLTPPDLPAKKARWKSSLLADYCASES